MIGIPFACYSGPIEWQAVISTLMVRSGVQATGIAGRAVAFIKSGSFSHINAAVESQLKSAFGTCELRVIDVNRLIRCSGLSVVVELLSAVRHYGLAELIRRGDPVDCLIQSPAMFRRLKELIGREVRKMNCGFTFQTQSMWDGATSGIPHFVYTDHTEMANLQYPAFDPAHLLGDWWLRLERQIYANASRVFVMSNHVGASLIKDYGCAADKVRCVFAGSNSDPSRLNRGGKPNREAPLILFVGVDWERKGGEQLLAAYQEIRKDRPSVRLRIIGCSPKVKVEGCEVLGRIALGEMPAHYAEAAVFCLPTRIEPFGIAFVEAMHAGLPIVGSDLGAVRDMVTDGVNGFRVAVDDIPATASALRRILDAPELAERMGRASRQLAMEKYSWPRVGQRLRSGILEALATVPNHGD